MLRISFPFLFTSAFLILTACSEPTSTAKDQISELGSDSLLYDAQLAQQLGADEYGMKSYVMAFLKRGPNRDRSPEEAQTLQRAHLDNINRLAKEGKLVLAGPFMDDGEVRGIYIFDVETVEEAEALTATDPAIQAGSLRMELHPWYGSAALLMLGDLYPKLAKKNI